MKAIPFYPCKICKYSSEKPLIPVLKTDLTENPENVEDLYKCEETDIKSIDKYGVNRLENCEASGRNEENIYCYKCKEGFYFDWKTQGCKPV